jgi:DSF synthase
MTNETNDSENSAMISTQNASRRQYRQIDVEYNPAIKILSTYLKPKGANCFNMSMLEELRHNDSELEKNNGQFYFNDNLCPVDYHVVASRNPNVFNFGGDLALFIMLIKSADKEGLINYAKLCVDCIYSRIVNYNSSVITISLVQGDALGGGFETVLSSNIIVAEESARMGLPEIIFNLFPGMGAYSLLSRRVGSRLAEEMISSGNIYQADELHKMGIVDILVPDGEGSKAISDLAKQQGKRINGLRAMYECRKYYQPILYSELMDITKVWVEAALHLTDKDLQMMSRLVRSQMRREEIYQDRNSGTGTTELKLAAA